MALPPTIAATKQQRDLFSFHADRGAAFQELDRRTEALEAFQKALDSRMEMSLRIHPGYLASIYFTIGKLQRVLGRTDQALAPNQEAQKILRKLIRDDPADTQPQLLQIDVLTEFGLSQRFLGRPDQALAPYREAREILQKLTRDKRIDNRVLLNLGGAVGDLAVAQFEDGRRSEALEAFREAVAINVGLINEGPIAVAAQTQLSRAYNWMGAVHLAMGQALEAVRSYRQAKEIMERLNSPAPDDLYGLACVYAQCGALVGHGKPRLSPDEQAERGAYADRAMNALHRAIATGWTNFAWMAQDWDLDLLRSHPVYRWQLADLTFPADPFQH
jgi:tetratricopeptide (TPR) repeat protein